ncbi:MAG: hypothetical protein ACRDT8_26280 [Micromonosporaceae bacterium]
MSLFAAAVTLLAGLVLGFAAGRGYQRAARAWTDYTAHKAATPALRANAWLTSRKAAGTLALSAGLAILALYLTAAADR